MELKRLKLLQVNNFFCFLKGFLNFISNNISGGERVE